MTKIGKSGKKVRSGQLSLRIYGVSIWIWRELEDGWIGWIRPQRRHERASQSSERDGQIQIQIQIYITRLHTKLPVEPLDAVDAHLRLSTLTSDNGRRMKHIPEIHVCVCVCGFSSRDPRGAARRVLRSSRREHAMSRRPRATGAQRSMDG